MTCKTNAVTKTVTLYRKDDLTHCVRQFIFDELKNGREIPTLEQVIQHVGGKDVWRSYTPAHRSKLSSALADMKWKKNHLTNLLAKYSSVFSEASITAKVEVRQFYSAGYSRVSIYLRGWVGKRDWVTGEGWKPIPGFETDDTYCDDEASVLKALEKFLPGGEYMCQSGISAAKSRVNSAKKDLRKLEKRARTLAIKRAEIEDINILSKG